VDRKIPLPLVLVLVLLAIAVARTPRDFAPTPDSTSPIAVDKLAVAIIEETSERSKLPAEQFAALMSGDVRQYIQSQGGELRLIDKDDKADQAPTWVQEALKLPRTGLPWLVIGSPKTGFSGPLPLSLAETVAEIKKHGGA
jgi:hypothetical protein